MNKSRFVWLCVGVLLVSATIVIIWFAHGVSEPTASTPKAAPQVVASQPVVAEPVTAPVSPNSLPPVIAKVFKEVHNTPMHRSMTLVAKNWLACQSVDLYSETEALLERQDPAVGSRFHGDPPACLMLMQGKHVKVTHQDADSTILAIHVDGVSTDLWTDAAALADHVPVS
ncbi:MAG: hypothetical protein NVS3B3_22580 [Aquirhabdus sp.]